MIGFLIYLYTVLEGVKVICLAVGTVTVLATAAYFLGSYSDGPTEERLQKNKPNI